MNNLLLTGFLLAAALQAGRADDAGVETNLIAVVLGEKITADRKAEVNGIIFGGLLQRYAAEKKIEPTPAELQTFGRSLENGRGPEEEMKADREALKRRLADPSITTGERKEKEEALAIVERMLQSPHLDRLKEESYRNAQSDAHREVARFIVTSWKINQSLHAQYGGRVIFQQAGPEPLDAYRDFLREREKAGDFQIFDPRCEADFWKYFTDDSMHNFLPKESGDQAMRTPWWTLKSCDPVDECLDR